MNRRDKISYEISRLRVALQGARESLQRGETDRAKWLILGCDGFLTNIEIQVGLFAKPRVLFGDDQEEEKLVYDIRFQIVPIDGREISSVEIQNFLLGLSDLFSGDLGVALRLKEDATEMFEVNLASPDIDMSVWGDAL